MAKTTDKEKTLETWLWDAACAIRGAQDAPKFKDYILPLVFVKRLCDVFDDEVRKLAEDIGDLETAYELVTQQHDNVRFYVPFRAATLDKPTWEHIRLLQADSKESLGQKVTDIMRQIAHENQKLRGIIDRIDYNATTHGQRDMDDDQLGKLIERISEKRLGLTDVEPDIIGRSYEYLIRKFAEGGGQSAGEFYTPREVGMVMGRILDPEPGMEVYDPNTGSAGLLIKMQLALDEKLAAQGKDPKDYAQLQLFGQELTPATWAMANMNTVIHDMQATIAIGNTMLRPNKFDYTGRGLKPFDRATANPMWNQRTFNDETYEQDELNRFGAGYAPGSSADWGWVQHILASLKPNGRAAIVLDTGAVSRGSGSAGGNREKEVRRWFVEQDLIEGVIYLPENLFYNTSAPGVILLINRQKPANLAGRYVLVNAGREFAKGNPKNYLTEANMGRVTAAYRQAYTATEPGVIVEKLSTVVTRDEVVKNDFNLSPSRYIHTADDIAHGSLSDLVEELRKQEADARQLDEQLTVIFEELGI